MNPSRQLVSKLSVIEGSKEFFHVCNRDFLDSLTDEGKSLIEHGCFLQFLIHQKPEQCVALIGEISAYMKTKEVMFAAKHPDEWKEMQETTEELRLEAEGGAS